MYGTPATRLRVNLAILSLRLRIWSSPSGQEAEAKDPVPYLVYVNSEVFEPAQIGSMMRDHGPAAVPCASLYGGPGGGTRFALVAMYRTLLGPVVD